MAEPYAKFRAGGVTATVWENEVKDKEGKVIEGRKAYSVSIEKSYTKDGKNWETTTNYNKDDLPKVVLVSNKAYEEISLAKGKE